jgi:hypothetical protein
MYVLKKLYNNLDYNNIFEINEFVKGDGIVHEFG